MSWLASPTSFVITILTPITIHGSTGLLLSSRSRLLPTTLSGRIVLPNSLHAFGGHWACGNVGLFVGWIGHSQVDINDILSRQAGHRGRTDMLDGQHPRAQCPPNACSEFGKTIRPLSVVGNNLDRLDRRRPVDPWIVIGVRIVMTNDVGDANHDIDATYHISRRNPSGCGRFRRQPCETRSDRPRFSRFGISFSPAIHRQQRIARGAADERRRGCGASPGCRPAVHSGQGPPRCCVPRAQISRMAILSD